MPELASATMAATNSYGLVEITLSYKKQCLGLFYLVGRARTVSLDTIVSQN